MFNHIQVNIPKIRKKQNCPTNNQSASNYNYSPNDKNVNISTSISRKISVPIKEYSNKYLILHQKDFQEKNLKRNLKKSLMQNKRKPFRKYKKINNQNCLNNVCKTQPNCQDFQENLQNIEQHQKDQNLFQKGSKSTYSRRQQNNFFKINTSVFSHFSSLSKKQLQIYEKLCERQNSHNTSAITKYKKIGEILEETNKLGEVQNIVKQNKKVEKISTSRALQKYSKIIKVNSQDTNSILTKMKIKKQFANYNFKNNKKTDICTKKIVLHKKEELNLAHKTNFQKISTNQHKDESNLNKEVCNTKGNFIMNKKIVRNRKRIKTQFQLEDYKQNLKGYLKKYEDQDNDDNFQINGWDINV